ncbi:MULTISPECIES: hypothetical protein [unclassified Microcoleus]|uniref:hypothetical protein n=1 Tax=unclassified Microcoleus TaxID=2642155 RepID=UPI002FD21660
MTINGWCRTNYHKDGKRRFAKLTDGLCCECLADGAFAPRKLRLDKAITEPVAEPAPEPVAEPKQSQQRKKETADRRKVTCLEQKITDLEVERDTLNSEIDRLRLKLQTFINSLNQSEVEQSGIKSGVAKT